MFRSTLILALIATLALTANAHSGELIVVEEVAPNMVTQTHELSSKDRSTFQRLVGEACYQRGRLQDDFKQASGKNSARVYCDCMAPVTAQNLTMKNAMTMFKTRQMDPAMQTALIPHVRECLQLAGYQQ